MAARIEFTKEQRREIRLKYSKARKLKDIKSYRHVVVLNMRRLGKTNAEIGEATGYNPQRVTEIVSDYVNKGMESVIGNKYTSHNRRMSYEEEGVFLEGFREEAEKGLLTSVTTILKRYEEKTGKESNTTTIYNLLARHGWRKLQPRPIHPEVSSEEEQERSKKTLKPSGRKSCWINI